MAHIREMQTKSGKVFYEISVSRGRGKSKLYKRWYPTEGWSKRTIQSKLNKVARDFEKEVENGQAVSRAETKQKELEALRELAKIQTLKQYGEMVFMPFKTPKVSENTRCSFQRCLDKRIYPALGSLKMPEITSADINAFLLSIQKEGKSHSTVIKHYTILKLLFKMAYMDDSISRNPMDKVERPTPRKDELIKTEIKSYTADEVMYILDCLDNESLKWQLYLRLLIDTGIRRGECCGLQWKNVDYKNCTITIENTLYYTPQKGVYLDTPKNGKKRTIDVDPEIMELLRKHQLSQASQMISNFVFTQDDSIEPMNPQSPTKFMKRFADKYNIEHLHPHKLRHSFASIAITNGADVASVSEKLGHSDKAVTLRMYTHADAESMKRASQIFRDALKRKEA